MSDCVWSETETGLGLGRRCKLDLCLCFCFGRPELVGKCPTLQSHVEVKK